MGLPIHCHTWGRCPRNTTRSRASSSISPQGTLNTAHLAALRLNASVGDPKRSITVGAMPAPPCRPPGFHRTQATQKKEPDDVDYHGLRAGIYEEGNSCKGKYSKYRKSQGNQVSLGILPLANQPPIEEYDRENRAAGDEDCPEYRLSGRQKEEAASQDPQSPMIP